MGPEDKHAYVASPSLFGKACLKCGRPPLSEVHRVFEVRLPWPIGKASCGPTG